MPQSPPEMASRNELSTMNFLKNYTGDMTTKDELKSAIVPKGYVRTADGVFTHVDNLRDKGHPRPAPAEQGRAGEATTASLPHPKFQNQQAVDNEAARRQAAEASFSDYVAGVS